jgi:hypothetical protein
MSKEKVEVVVGQLLKQVQRRPLRTSRGSSILSVMAETV